MINKPKLYKQGQFWICECKRGIVGISDDIKEAFNIWKNQLSQN
jgi:hypothetical protein